MKKAATSKINNYINHIAFVLDESGSMGHLQNKVIDVFDNQIEFLAKRSQELDQETRVTIYAFADNTRNITYDKDVLRLPSLRNHYNPDGLTALIEATQKAINDLKKTPELYGDHAFLIYVLTDGGNNKGNHLASALKKEIEGLPENWTLAVLVPDQTGVFAAKGFGFPAQNISVWDATSAKGFEKAGATVRQATETFMTNRAQGIRGSKNLFTVDAKNLTKSAVKNTLTELNPSEYDILDVRKKVAVQPFVESWKLPFRKGANYYQLMKAETVQNYKQVIVQDKVKGKLYAGVEARQLLGLPDQEVKVTPGDFKDYSIFVQSTSTNRNLVPGTQLIVLK